MFKAKYILKNNKGQGLIEYLIIVALIGVAAIGIVQTLQDTVTSQFSHVTNAIGGNKKSQDIQTTPVVDADFKKRGLKDFMNRAENNRK